MQWIVFLTLAKKKLFKANAQTETEPTYKDMHVYLFALHARYIADWLPVSKAPAGDAASIQCNGSHRYASWIYKPPHNYRASLFSSLTYSCSSNIISMQSGFISNQSRAVIKRMINYRLNFSIYLQTWSILLSVYSDCIITVSTETMYGIDPYVKAISNMKLQMSQLIDYSGSKVTQTPEHSQ